MNERDYDLSTMHNRIKLLQMEEERALKKVALTRRRAENIINMQNVRKANMSISVKPPLEDSYFREVKDKRESSRVQG